MHSCCKSGENAEQCKMKKEQCKMKSGEAPAEKASEEAAKK
jgi:hypothetical protein